MDLKCFSIITSIVIPVSTLLAVSILNFILIGLGTVTLDFVFVLEIGLVVFSGLFSGLLTFYLGKTFCS